MLIIQVVGTGGWRWSGLGWMKVEGVEGGGGVDEGGVDLVG